MIGIYFYELRYRSIWDYNLRCSKCPHLSMDMPSSWTMAPNLFILLSKYFFLLIVGITTGLWINLNSKTFVTWKKFFCCQPTMIPNEQHQSPQQIHRYGSQHGRDALGINYSYKHTKISGSKYSLPSTKQIPIAHV